MQWIMLLLFYAESASKTTLWQANPGLILIFDNKHLIAAPMNYFSLFKYLFDSS